MHVGVTCVGHESVSPTQDDAPSCFECPRPFLCVRQAGCRRKEVGGLNKEVGGGGLNKGVGGEVSVGKSCLLMNRERQS